MKLSINAVAETLRDVDHIDDIKIAASKMSLIDRYALQVKMAVKYCAENARQANDDFVCGAFTACSRI